jgi:hypothetical protein
MVTVGVVVGVFVGPGAGVGVFVGPGAGVGVFVGPGAGAGVGVFVGTPGAFSSSRRPSTVICDRASGPTFPWLSIALARTV